MSRHEGRIRLVMWARFDRYAWRVKKIHHLFSTCHSDEAIDIDPRLYLDLYYSRPYFPLFRGLRSLRCSSVKGTPLTISYLCSDLVDVHLESYYLLDHYIRDLSEAPCAANVESLSLKGRITRVGLEDLLRFVNLRSLVLHIDNPVLHIGLAGGCEVFAMLEQFPHLVFLKRLEIAFYANHIPSSIASTSLAGIKHLDIHTSAHAMAQVLTAGVFETVVLRFIRLEEASCYNECFSSLANSAGRLQAVTIHTGCLQMHDFPAAVYLRPLFSAHHLRSVVVLPSYGFNIILVDSDLQDMMIAWPLLRSLILCPSKVSPAAWNPSMQPTFGCLRVISNALHIERLSIRANNRFIQISE